MPYNSETETFYQAPATVVDSTPDGDTVQEGFDDRLTPAMAGVYTDLNLLKGNGMIGVGIPATTTARGIGRVATSADLVDGATITNGPAFLAAGVNTSVAAAAGKVPVADSNSKIDAWVSQQTQFATCATAAATAAKEATLTGFSLAKGARVLVTFSNTNTVTGALTLNVNETGAKAVYNSYGATSATNPAQFMAGQAYEFIYDGAHWVYHDANVLGPVLSTISATGTWTITGCRAGVPMLIMLQGSTSANDIGGALIRPVSGVLNGDLNGMALGLISGSTRPNFHVLIPSADTVVLSVYNITTSPTCYLRAYQQGV